MKWINIKCKIIIKRSILRISYSIICFINIFDYFRKFKEYYYVKFNIHLIYIYIYLYVKPVQFEFRSQNAETSKQKKFNVEDFKKL